MAADRRMMRAARMHEVGQPMRIDMVERPVARSHDVVVEVKACGMVPNLGNVLANWPKWCPHLPQPKLPAIFGLDPAGVVSEVGDCVIGIRPGDRVYVNPARSCSACYHCLSGNRQHCSYFTFNGYFGFQPESQRLFDLYPQGGFCEFMSAPQYAIAKLPDEISFYEAARLGYVGTGYSALKKCGPLAGRTVLINGISGTLGVGTALCAIGLGATRILGTGRNRDLLEQVRKLAPQRIEVFSTSSGSVAEWARQRTGGKGADFMVDTLGAMASLEAFVDAMRGLRRGGKLVNIGGTAGEVPIHTKWLMDEQIHILGSVWFSTAEAYELIELARTKLVDLSVFRHEVAKLEDINDAISGVGSGGSGFRNFVIVP